MIEMSKWISWCPRYTTFRFHADSVRRQFEFRDVDVGECLGHFGVRLVMDIYEAEVEVLAIQLTAVWRFVVILKPVGADDVRQLRQFADRVRKCAGPCGLRGDGRESTD